MTERYVCWEEGDEDPGDSPPPRHVVEDFDVEGAAEEYAERCYIASGEWADKYVVNVRDSSGIVSVVDVEVEAVPTYSGSVRT